MDKFMYTNFYHFKSDPFSETPNTEFYFSSNSHMSALQRLASHLDEGRGFISITGEVGTGKTMLTRYLIKMCEDEINTAYIYWPSMGKEELIETICREFGLIKEKRTFAGLEEFLLKNAQADRRSVLFIDEAQSLPYESIEMIRLLSNLESETKKLIQIVVLGQPEFDSKLKTHEYRQIAQRISLRIELLPLPLKEVEAYIKHRIEVAKGATAIRFEIDAIKTINELSRGVPRLINLICRTALTTGASEGARIITTKLIRKSLMQYKLIDQKSFGIFKRERLAIGATL